MYGHAGVVVGVVIVVADILESNRSFGTEHLDRGLVGAETHTRKGSCLFLWKKSYGLVPSFSLVQFLQIINLFLISIFHCCWD